jgi:NAD(P)-dependent dehydrogenase (short-subunit alcohol dehydrogenase family)
MSRFDATVAIVTGAARGIGRACAQLLADQGAVVIGVDVDAAVTEPGAVEAEAWSAVVGDVTDQSTVTAALTAARQAPGRLGVLVNAAFWEERAELLDGTDDGWLRTYQVSTVGAVRMAAEFARAVDGPGAVVNVASVHAYAARTQFGAYSAAKAAMTAFTRTAAVEWGPRAVRVNAVAPGFIAVERNAALWRGPQARDPYPPLRRAGQPDDVARAVAFLASDDAAFITGTVLPVDGGLIAQLPEEFHP